MSNINQFSMQCRLLIIACFLLSAVLCIGQEKQDQPHERIIKTYFAGWVNKDWDIVSSQLADGFTFTSAAPDDHIPLDKFREKCWVQAQHIQRFDFVKII